MFFFLSLNFSSIDVVLPAKRNRTETSDSWKTTVPLATSRIKGTGHGLKIHSKLRDVIHMAQLTK